MGATVTLQNLTDIIYEYFSQGHTDEELINELNHLRKTLHRLSPFSHEPVDCVLWIKTKDIVANE